MISRTMLNLSEYEDTPLQWSQFLIQSCFGLTIQKPQGEIMENGLIYLAKLIFQHGQLHVTLSQEKEVKMLQCS